MCGNLILLGLMVSYITQTSPVSPQELLAKYEQTQQAFLKQVAKSETWVEARDSQRDNVPVWTKIEAEFRYDGAGYDSLRDRRYEFIRKTWRPLDARDAPTPIGRASGYRQIWDGNTLYDSMLYANGNMQSLFLNALIVDRNPARDYHRNVYVGNEGAPLDGALDGDVMPFPAVCREQEVLGVRDAMEAVNGSPCYVLEARGKHGTYTVWIDPAHGYNMARAEVSKRGSDWAYGECMAAPETKQKFRVTELTSRLENTRFEKHGDVWVPMEAEMERHTTYNEGERAISEKRHHKRTVIDLDPDFEAMGAFKPDIPNGTEIYDVDIPAITFQWQDGQLVPNIDAVAVAAIDEQVAAMKAERAAPRMIETPETPPGEDETRITAAVLLDRYRAAQSRLQSIVAIGRSWTEYLDSEGRLVYAEMGSSEFRSDGNRVAHRVTLSDPNVPNAPASWYRSFLWDGKMLIQYVDGPDAADTLMRKWPNEMEKSRLIATEYRGAPLLGICAGDADRVDIILGRAQRLSLRPGFETIRDMACYVIEGVTRQGQYTVWISSAHGYNIVKIDVKREDSAPVSSFQLDEVRFKEVSGRWVPVRAEIRAREGGVIRKCRYERTSVMLDPDHRARRSFVADDIPDPMKP